MFYVRSQMKTSLQKNRYGEKGKPHLLQPIILHAVHFVVHFTCLSASTFARQLCYYCVCEIKGSTALCPCLESLLLFWIWGVIG